MLGPSATDHAVRTEVSPLKAPMLHSFQEARHGNIQPHTRVHRLTKLPLPRQGSTNSSWLPLAVAIAWWYAPHHH